MITYMAGGISGNCKPLWCDLAKALKQGGQAVNVYLAGCESRNWVVDLYIAGIQGNRKGFAVDQAKNKTLLADPKSGKVNLAILESFYYADEYTETLIPCISKFLLDSGAFTFFTAGQHVDWNDYVKRYIDFINRNKVDLFFELDIDPLVGYPKVLELRERIEQGTGKRPIPVWHKSRGRDEFLKMCEEYDYVAIGGIVSKEIDKDDYKYFPWFINEAHKRGAKIHGLGFTNLEGLTKYHFDSVDSTSWTAGNRFGHIYTFNGKTMVKVKCPQGTRLKDSREAAVRNFNEWVKFQKYAQRNL